VSAAKSGWRGLTPSVALRSIATGKTPSCPILTLGESGRPGARPYRTGQLVGFIGGRTPKLSLEGAALKQTERQAHMETRPRKERGRKERDGHVSRRGFAKKGTDPSALGDSLRLRQSLLCSRAASIFATSFWVFPTQCAARGPYVSKLRKAARAYSRASDERLASCKKRATLERTRPA